MSSWSEQKKFVSVDGRRMAYVEMGSGRPIVFQHGNPTSSYLWRNILPKLADLGRCIAVDLIGMGDSDKLPDSGPGRYTFAEQSHYLDGAFSALGLESDIVFVLHDWGSALGFDWMRRHPQGAAGVAHMEGIVKPLRWDEWPPAATEIFQAFRSEAGEDLVLNKNVFVENVLPKSILRGLSEEEMEVYRAPFRHAGEDRRPTLTWPRQIPIAGEPADVVRIAQDYSQWMAENELPKLFVNAEPGAILVGAVRDFCRSWKNQTEVTVPGSHFIQEDSGPAIGQAIARWMKANAL